MCFQILLHKEHCLFHHIHAEALHIAVITVDGPDGAAKLFRDIFNYDLLHAALSGYVEGGVDNHLFCNHLSSCSHIMYSKHAFMLFEQ